MKRFLSALSVIYLAALLVGIISVFFLGDSWGLEQNIESILLPPSTQHWFGTDSLGRDLFARVLIGGRISLFVGVFCALLSCSIGFFYGAIAGWFEGNVDRFLMRFCDILMALPSFVLVSILCLMSQLLLPIQDSEWRAILSLCIGISATHWMSTARITRGMVMDLRRRPFIEAAIALGGTRTHIILRHILPNMAGTLMILIAMQIPANMMYESFMSFVGLGVHPPQTSWGILVKEGWKTLSSFPHLILCPSLILFLTIWTLHLVPGPLSRRIKLLNFDHRQP